MSSAATLPNLAPPIRLTGLVWVVIALVVMVAVLASGDLWAINFMHVMCGVLWTGIDLFMGFVIGPILRQIPPAARAAVITRLLPKTLFLMPTLSIITGTAGWYYASLIGFMDLPWPTFGWVLAALLIITALTIQGLFILLPTNLIVYLELRKPQPDTARIGRLMRRYVWYTGLQGCMQVAIIVVMARFVTGL